MQFLKLIQFDYKMLFDKKPVGKLFKFGKAFSFYTMLAFLTGVLYLIVFQHEFLPANVLSFAIVFAAMILINAVFPRILKMVKKNSLSDGMLEGSKEFAEKVSVVVTWVTLTATYFVGVGSVFILSRLVGKRFMEIKTKKKSSYWIEKKETGKIEEMF